VFVELLELVSIGVHVALIPIPRLPFFASLRMTALIAFLDNDLFERTKHGLQIGVENIVSFNLIPVEYWYPGNFSVEEQICKLDSDSSGRRA
jgi:hypothetical protein